MMTQEDRNRAERKLRAAGRIAARHLPAGLPPVLYLTDVTRTPDPVTTASRLPAGWGVIYRAYDHGNRLGVTRLRTLARASSLPVYALGGLNADTAGSAASVAGIAGIEGIEAVFGPRT